MHGLLMLPVIAITTDRRPQGPHRETVGRVRPPRPEVHLGEALVAAVRGACAEVILLPPVDDDPTSLVEWVLDHVDGVVISGGAFDIHPRHYGQAVNARLDRIDEGRTGLELSLARASLRADKPVLGVCGGMQALAVAAGGTLLQDVTTGVPGALEHEQPTDPATAWHAVLLEEPLRTALGVARIEVNSTHHQAVDSPGALVVAGRAPDGIGEAVVMPGHRFALGVQWHPELLDAWPFRLLVGACGSERGGVDWS